MKTIRQAVVARQGNGLYVARNLRNPCPTCGAKPGYRCTRIGASEDSPFQFDPIKRPHASRVTPRKKAAA